MRGSWSLLVLVLVAGCADDAEPQVHEVAVEEPGQTAIREGSVAGVVFDPALHPVQGATVAVPGLERTATSDAEGRFAFSSLPPGAVFVRAEHPDYLPAAAEGEVRPGDILELRLVMEPSNREPHVQVFEFAGFAEVADWWTFSACSECMWQFDIDPGPEHLVVEMVSSRDGGVLGQQDFNWRLLSGTDTHGEGWLADPGRLSWSGDDVPRLPSLTLEAQPSGLVPGIDVAFQVYVAAFYNGADPDAWSVLEGRA